MTETKGCIILLFTVFITFFLLLMTAQVCTEMKLRTFMANQEKVNETTCEQDQKQNSAIRQLKQDAEIWDRLLTTKEYLQEE